jgi:hypothetical protein
VEKLFRTQLRKIFPRAWLFYPGRNQKLVCFQHVTFGLVRALRKPEGGRRAEDPFRGLRAGPARSSPRLLPPPTPKPHPMDHTHRRKHVYTPLHKILRSKFANCLSAKHSRLNPQLHPSKYMIHVRREKLAGNIAGHDPRRQERLRRKSYVAVQSIPPVRKNR